MNKKIKIEKGRVTQVIGNKQARGKGDFCLFGFSYWGYFVYAAEVAALSSVSRAFRALLSIVLS